MSDALLSCPFNLRRGLIIQVQLPSDLTLKDVRRIVRFLVTMAGDYEPEMGPPSVTFPEAPNAGAAP
jgi:hypothetical protein